MNWDSIILSTGNWSVLGPILPLMITGILQILLGMFWKKTTLRHMSIFSVIGTLIAVAFWFFSVDLGSGDSHVFGYLMIRDELTYILHPLILFVVLVLSFVSEPFLKRKEVLFNEFYPLLLWSASGAMLIVSTTNWLMIFIALELFSLSLYVLCGLNIYKKRSEESALKYFLLGSFASAFILYGIALLYGATGSLRMDMTCASWSVGSSFDQGLLLLGHLMVLIGFFFKLGVVPFHFWSPDVYQGALTNVTAYMATVGKVVSLGVLVRILEAIVPFRSYFLPLMVVLTLLTLFVSNVMALRQVSVKRLLAYSSISHSGYLMVGLLSAYTLYENAKGSFIPHATLQYLWIYSLITLGIFVILIFYERKEKEDILIDHLKSLWTFSPLLGFGLIVFMLSIAGIPPFVGFFAKINLFLLSIEAKQYGLLGGLLLGSLMGVGYYLKVAQLAFSDLNVSQIREGLWNPIYLLIGMFIAISLGISPFIFPMFFR